MDFLNKPSYLSQEGLQDKSDVFLKSRGFGKLLYGSGNWINKLHRSERKSLNSI